MKFLKLTLSVICIYILSLSGIKSQNILLGPEHFDANVIHQLPCNDICNLWISLAENKAHSILYYPTGGCNGGYAGYAGSNNNYYFGALRSPAVCTGGQQHIKVKYNFSNSYIASHIDYLKHNFDQSRVSMWDVEWGKTHAEYVLPDSIIINGISSGYNYMNQFTILFDKVRSCDTIEAYFTMPSYPSNKVAYFYIDAICGYNDKEAFSFAIDNIEISAAAATDCSVSTSIAGVNISNKINIYKEINNRLTISSGLSSNSVINVYNTEGRLILHEMLYGRSTKEISLSAYPKGLYYVKVINEDQVIDKKILIY